MVLFPGKASGIGGPVLQAMAYKKPLLVNQYEDMQELMDKGPEFLLIDDKVTNETISDVYEILHSNDKREDMVRHNFSVLKKNFSSDLLDSALLPLIDSCDSPSFISRWKKGLINKTKKLYRK